MAQPPARQTSDRSKPLSSVIVPVYNGAAYLQACLDSVLSQQQIPLDKIELVVYNDASTDATRAVLETNQPFLAAALHKATILHGEDGPLGVGTARNKACEMSVSPILVFADADDVMLPTRVARSLRAFDTGADIIGGSFERIPAGSTLRYEAYHRRLRNADLFAHAFRDAPMAFPTVACRRAVWERVRFREGRGVPEDLHFFYDAMAAGFSLHKVSGDPLCQYRFHDGMTSLSLHRRTLLGVRVAAFETLVLSRPRWRNGFSIWGAGRDGKDVFRRLSEAARRLVRAWGDVDPNKIGRTAKGRPVVHFSQLKSPIACCVALDREDGAFERNLATLGLRMGEDYVHLI